MEVCKNSDIPHDEWWEFISGSDNATAFQTPEFYQFYNSVPGCSADATAIYERGKINALLVITNQRTAGLSGFFSKRAIAYGGPVLGQSSDALLTELIIRSTQSLKGNPIYLEIRNNNDYSAYKRAYSGMAWRYVPYLNISLDCKGKTMDDILKGMTYNRRREIRLSVEAGATVHECTSDNELREFYLILSNLYETRVKLPLPSYDFFRLFREKQIGPVFIVRHNEKVIGGSVCPCLPGRSINTLYYCGLRDYHKRIYPNHLAVMGPLEYAVRNKIDLLDFMGAGLPSKNYGVREYKKEFGGQLREYGRYVKILNPVLYYLGKSVLSIKKKSRK